MEEGEREGMCGPGQKSEWGAWQGHWKPCVHICFLAPHLLSSVAGSVSPIRRLPALGLGWARGRPGRRSCVCARACCFGLYPCQQWVRPRGLWRPHIELAHLGAPAGSFTHCPLTSFHLGNWMVDVSMFPAGSTNLFDGATEMFSGENHLAVYLFPTSSTAKQTCHTNQRVVFYSKTNYTIFGWPIESISTANLSILKRVIHISSFSLANCHYSFVTSKHIVLSMHTAQCDKLPVNCHYSLITWKIIYLSRNALFSGSHKKL